jgi:DNA repair protein RadC
LDFADPPGHRKATGGPHRASDNKKKCWFRGGESCVNHRVTAQQTTADGVSPHGAGARERLLEVGEQPLADAELLALLLGSGGAGDPVHAVAWRVLATFGSLRAMAKASVAELVQVPGVGPAKAARLKASLELARRLAREESPDRPRFVTSRTIFDFVHLALRDLRHEVFDILLLDAKNRLVRQVRVSVGTLTGSLVHPREVYRAAVVEGAAAVVLVHNHPSGDPTPSRDDLEVTARLVSAGDVLGIRVLDHVVVGDGRYFSMADSGELLHSKTST